MYTSWRVGISIGIKFSPRCSLGSLSVAAAQRVLAHSGVGAVEAPSSGGNVAFAGARKRRRDSDSGSQRCAVEQLGSTHTLPAREPEVVNDALRVLYVWPLSPQQQQQA